MQPDLIKRAGRGDREAQDAVVREYYGYVMGFLIKLTFNRELSEDLTQETFIKALRALPAYRGEAELGSWLVAIAHNLYRDHVRALARKKTVPLEDLPLSDEAMQAQGMQMSAEAREAMERLKALPPGRRELIVLKYYYGYTSKEIARMMRLPQGTVRSRLHYALKSMLGEEGDGLDAV